VSAAARERGEEGREPWRPGLVYHSIRSAVWIAARLVHRVVIEGRENVPREGGLIVASNHQSHVDIPLLAATVPRVVTFVARDTLEESRLLAFVMRECGTVLVRRGQADRKAIQGIVRRLEQGGCVSIFPEGTRTHDGSLGEMKGGAVLAARLAGVPILPVTIRGALEVMPRGVSLPRPRRVWVRFGAPLDPRGQDALERLRAAIEGPLGDGRFPRA
jgi:1-acyl-sn-glycerol-3-phosphate acyltransferase